MSSVERELKLVWGEWQIDTVSESPNLVSLVKLTSNSDLAKTSILGIHKYPMLKVIMKLSGLGS